MSAQAANKQVIIRDSTLSLSKRASALDIGHVQAGTDINFLSESTFVANKKFINLMHSILKENIHEDKFFQSLAATYQNNYMAIYDFRSPPVYGRIPEVQDIFGMVRVDSEGEIVPGSYEKNDMYRIVTSDGICQFSDDILHKLRAACEKQV
ncbi:hypothetical protein V1514DRAFT_322854 [Lipomyces japonicus]|uniref:uncharacterized protein n=1 Tax=Lipomyces japonicus TaxID=56871 RepID=UPI0034CE71C8